MNAWEVNGVLRRFGWRPDLPDHRDQIHAPTLTAEDIAALPPSVDLRANCGPILDQGSLGSCTAHAGVSALQFLAKRLGLPVPDLSRLYLYYRTRVDIEGGSAGYDSGAQLRDVVRALAKFGVCRSALDPYETMQFAEPPSAEADADAARHKATLYVRVPTIGVGGLPTMDLIRHCLAQGFPALYGFAVPNNIHSDYCLATGIVTYPAPGEPIIGGHAVLAVGYDDEKRLMRFQNSWSPQWGDGGFGYLPYSFVENYLAEDFWSVRAELLP